jgi:hypothetical protein
LIVYLVMVDPLQSGAIFRANINLLRAKPLKTKSKDDTDANTAKSSLDDFEIPVALTAISTSEGNRGSIQSRFEKIYQNVANNNQSLSSNHRFANSSRQNRSPSHRHMSSRHSSSPSPNSEHTHSSRRNSNSNGSMRVSRGDSPRAHSSNSLSSSTSNSPTNTSTTSTTSTTATDVINSGDAVTKRGAGRPPGRVSTGGDSLSNLGKNQNHSQLSLKPINQINHAEVPGRLPFYDDINDNYDDGDAVAANVSNSLLESGRRRQQSLPVSASASTSSSALGNGNGKRKRGRPFGSTAQAMRERAMGIYHNQEHNDDNYDYDYGYDDDQAYTTNNNNNNRTGKNKRAPGRPFGSTKNRKTIDTYTNTSNDDDDDDDADVTSVVVPELEPSELELEEVVGNTSMVGWDWTPQDFIAMYKAYGAVSRNTNTEYTEYKDMDTDNSKEKDRSNFWIAVSMHMFSEGGVKRWSAEECMKQWSEAKARRFQKRMNLNMNVSDADADADADTSKEYLDKDKKPERETEVAEGESERDRDEDGVANRVD